MLCVVIINPPETPDAAATGTNAPPAAPTPAAGRGDARILDANQFIEWPKPFATSHTYLIVQKYQHLEHNLFPAVRAYPKTSERGIISC